METGFTSLSASNIQDALGNKLATGTLEVLPTDTNDHPLAGSCNGVLLTTAASVSITNGALPPNTQIPISASCNPENLCFRLTVKNANGSTLMTIPLVQPTGAGLDLDTLSIPSNPPLRLIQKGDQGIPGPTGSPGNFGPVVKTCYQLGCAMDGVTDDQAIINAFLAGASSASPRVLLVDGWMAVSKVVLSPNGYTSIIGMGDTTGFHLLTGAYSDVIALGYNTTTDPGAPAPAVTAQDVLLANFRIDGNRAGQHGNWNGTWTFGINITSCNNVRIQNVSVEHASTYSIRVGNVSKVLISGCRLMPFLDNETVSATNTDGIHVNGPSEDVIISDCYFRTGDDSIALNCPEGYSGSIQRVSIFNCTLNQSQTGVRIYALSSNTATGIINQITVRGLTGSVNVAAFIMGLEVARTLNAVDSMRNISISGVNISGPRFMLVSDNIGEMSISDCTWSEAAFSAGFIQAWFNNTTWSNVSIRNIRFLRDSLGNSQSSVVDTVTMTQTSGQAISVLQLYIAGVSIEDLGSGTTPHDYAQIPVLNLSTGTFIAQLTTADLSLRFGYILSVSGNPATVAQYPTFVSTIASTDLLKMQAIPDAQAYVGTLYYSLDHGNALSVNINGTRSTITTTSH